MVCGVCVWCDVVYLCVGIVYRKRSRSHVDGSAPPEEGVEGDGEPTAKRVKRTEAPEAGNEVQHHPKTA